VPTEEIQRALGRVEAGQKALNKTVGRLVELMDDVIKGQARTDARLDSGDRKFEKLEIKVDDLSASKNKAYGMGAMFAFLFVGLGKVIGWALTKAGVVL